MSKLSILTEADVDQTRPQDITISADGYVSSFRLTPPEYSVSLDILQLDAGATVEWPTEHDEEAIYVLDGELSMNSHSLPADGAVIASADSPLLGSVGVPTRLARFIGKRRRAQESDGTSSDGEEINNQYFGTSGWYRSSDRPGVEATWFADSTLPSCELALFRVKHDAGFTGNPHSHSSDEIIYIIDGSIKLGRNEYFPGTAICVPADIRYRVAYPNGGTFLNFRDGYSEQLTAGSDTAVPDTAEARGGVYVGDFR